MQKFCIKKTYLYIEKNHNILSFFIGWEGLGLSLSLRGGLAKMVKVKKHKRKSKLKEYEVNFDINFFITVSAENVHDAVDKAINKRFGAIEGSPHNIEVNGEDYS